MAERMTFVLDGRDNLSGTLNRAGDSADRLDRRITGAMNNSNQAVGRFTRDTRGRLHDARGHFLSAGQAAQVMAAHTAQLAPSMTRVANATAGVNNQLGILNTYTRDANGRLRDMRGRFVTAGDGAGQLNGQLGRLAPSLRSVAAGGGQASAALGGGGGALGPVLGVVAVLLGMSLLPALGALIPMLAGAGVAAGTLTLGFRGVSDAVALATTDKKEYAKALAKLPAPAREFTKALVGIRKEFTDLAGPIQKAMLPGFTKAIKASGPVVDILGRSMTELGGGFGDAATGASRLMKDSGFQKDFTGTLKLGNVFVKDLTSSMGPFVRSLLDFGAASGPTLKAFSSGISGLLGKGGGGLGGMFDGLKTGISGSAAFLDGFFGMLNRVLPALGRFGGEAARALGPLFGQGSELTGRVLEAALDGLGQALKFLSPVFKDVAFGVQALNTMMDLTGPTIRDTAGAIIGGLLPSFAQVDGATGPFERLNDTVNRNKLTIQEMSRIMGGAVLDFVSIVVTNLPSVIGGFRLVTNGVLSSAGTMIHGLAAAFGSIPGIGDKLKGAAQSFDSFKENWLSGLKGAEEGARQFAATAVPKLAAGKLQLNINNWESQIATAKGQLKTVPASKRADLLARIADLQLKAAQARGELATIKSKTVDVTARDRASATARSIQAAIARIQGKTVTVHTINMTSSVARTNAKLAGFASGGRPDPGQVAWVGENGPELMRFGGGEEIYDHRTSMNMAAAASRGPVAGAGLDAGRGLASGLRSSLAPVEKASRAMASAVVTGIRAELEIASPSKKTKALAADTGKGFIVGLTGSKAKIAAVAKDLVKDIWAAWKGTRSTKDSQLVAMVNRDTAKLQTLATKRDSLTKTIADARKLQADLWTAAREGAGLNNLGLAQEDVSAGSIQGGLAAKLAQMRQFTGYIGELAKKGLNKDLLKQILNMGPDQGTAYASALVGADKATFAGINSLQTQIVSASASVGYAGADAMYDAGANAGKGFLTGLASQQKAIEAQMVTIAKGMENAIKKALGIRSPATKMMPHGENATKGVGVGALAGIPFLDRAMATVAGRVSAVRPVMGAAALPAGAAGGGGRVINVYVTYEGLVVDPMGTARQLQKLLLMLRRERGGNVDLGLGTL